jgi:TolA-binding protein
MRKTFITALLLCGIATQALAGSSSRAIESQNHKVSAPTKEDSADYFAENRVGISAETAQKADGLRIKTMNSIKALLDNKKNSRQEFELTLRLGELHVERADYLRDLEIQSYLKEYDRWEHSDTKTRAAKAPTAVYKNSDASLYNAVQVFRKLVAKYPTHPRTDAVLYGLGSTLGRLNDDNAVNYYKQMIKSHPKSPLIPDSWLAMGEFYFDKHDIQNARESYQQVMNFKTHRAYPYAVYKLGWCFYNSQGSDEKKPDENIRKSIAAFQLVVKLSDKKKAQNFNLREEALRDLVMVYAEAEDTDGAWAYFRDIGEKDKFYNMLERMGVLYSEAGKDAKAIEVYTRLVKESSNRKNNPQIYQKMVGLYDNMQKFSEVVETIRTMKTYYVEESQWTSANKNDSKTIEGAKVLTERTMHRYGTMFHSRGQKIKNHDLEAFAAEIYTLYLESFVKMEPAYDIRFYLADIQNAQKKYIQASANFIIVAQQKPKDGKHLKEAAFNAVESISTLVSVTKFAPVPPPAQAPKALDIPRIRKLYADTMDFYVGLLPAEATGLPMRFSAAQIYFDYGHYPEAIKRFADLADKYSGSKQGQTAARTIIAYFNEKADWNSVVAYGKKFQTNKSIIADLSIKKFIDDSLRGALFNSAMASEKGNDHSKAADSFLEFQRLFPQDANADRALFNASMNQFRAGKVEDSIETQKRLLSTYNKSVLCPDVMASMAETYEAIAQFQLAAETYRKFADFYPNDKRAPLSLYNAGVLLRGVQKMDLAAKSFADLYTRYPNHTAANDAILESARIKEANDDLKGAIYAYSMFAESPSGKGKNDGLFAGAKSVELRLSADNKHEAARKDLSKLLHLLRSKGAPAAPAARRIVAKILFNDQEAGAKSFRAMTLDNGKEIEKQAAAKQAKLVRLANAYQDIILLGNAELTVASYYRLGELHEDFANALFNAPPPAGAGQKEAAEFKSQLDKAAFPLKEEASKFFETAYRQSSEVETFSSWTQKTYQKMVQLSPEKYPAVQEQSASPGYMSYKVSLTRATENLAD